MTNHTSINGAGASSEGPGSTSTSLLQQARSHNPEAWSRLTQLYSPVVYSWCRHFRVRPDDAADVLQNVFQAVHTGIAGFRRDRPSDSFRGWLWTVTRNKVRDHFRAARDEPLAKGGTDAQQWLATFPMDEPRIEEFSSTGSESGGLFRSELEHVRAEFEERTWKAFWRTAVDQTPTADIAAELDMSVNAVRKAKSRVLRRLREEFRDLID